MNITPIKPDPTLIRIPSDCTLVNDPKANRLSSDQCAAAVNCFARDDGARQLKLLCTSGLKGSPGFEWVEAQAQSDNGIYTFCFFARGGMLSNCFRLKTPRGSMYDIVQDGGDPFSDVEIGDRTSLTAILINSKRKEEGVEVVPCFIISVNGSRPYSAHPFYTLEEAEAAASEQRAHYAKYSNPSADKEAQSTEKALAKERSSVAFKSKSKGLTKSKK